VTPLTTPAAALTPTDVATVVEKAWEQFLLAERRAANPHPTHVYASAWRACERRMVYELTVPDQQPAFDAFTLAKFRRGDDRERDILSDLQRIGRNADPPFAIIGQQESFRVRDRQGRQVISGKVDAFLSIATMRAPIEVKAWSANLVDRLDTFDDVFENVWTRSGGFQILAYLFGHSLPVGFLVLDRSGLPKLIPVMLDDHLGKMEEFLAKAERVVDHAQAGTLPDFIDDPSECRRCPFYGAVCNPPLSAKVAQVVTDPSVEVDLHRWHALKAIGKEWSALDYRLKQQFRGIESAIAGPFSITGRWQTLTKVDLPPDVKKQYLVRDPKGRFVLEIDKLGDGTGTSCA
jgi:hypothetical protein